jgi:two-component sensor histidine kinase/CheY-like chemotaxis protein
MADRQKILIVDDKEENLYALEKVLEKVDADIIKATSGNDALIASLNHEFALAILDVQMPGMDGYELAEFIRAEEKTRHIPIIFMSAVYSDDYYVFKGYDAGGVDYMVKPYNPAVLLSKVSVFLQLHRQQAELLKHREHLEEQVKQRTSELQKEITERKRMERRIRASLKEKEVLLKEVHHRVKNNMQVIISMLNLQSGYIDDEQAIEAFRKSQDRIRTMALVHEKLYQAKDLARINFAEYTRDLTNYLLSAYGSDAGTITLKMDIEDISLSIDTAVTCGMILNELITNSIKHAFSGGRGGEIFIELHSDNDKLILTAGDNGAEIPEDPDSRKTESLGLQLIDAFVEQLEGSVELNRKDGTEFRITFPIRKYDKRG